MTEAEKNFLDALAKLLCSFAIDEVRCDVMDGLNCIIFYSNGRYFAFRNFRDGTYYDIHSQLSDYISPYGGDLS